MQLIEQPSSIEWANTQYSPYLGICWVWDPEIGWLPFSWFPRTSRPKWSSIHLVELLEAGS